jgi:hypothetical protein
MAKKSNYLVRLIKQVFILIFRVIAAIVAPSDPKKSQRRSLRSAGLVAAGDTPYVWPKLDDCEFEIVGESNYQDAIKRLAGDHGSEPASAEFRAMLVPEVNPHDHLAVRVDGQGVGTVGYMSRDDARSFRRRLTAKKLGDAATLCFAEVTGGGTARNGNKLFYGVRLAIKPFE